MLCIYTTLSYIGREEGFYGIEATHRNKLTHTIHSDLPPPPLFSFCLNSVDCRTTYNIEYYSKNLSGKASTDILKEQEEENRRQTNATNAALQNEKIYLEEQANLLKEQSLQNKQNLFFQQELINQQEAENYQQQLINQQEAENYSKQQSTYDQQRELNVMMEQQSLMMKQYTQYTDNNQQYNVQKDIPRDCYQVQEQAYDAMMPIRRYDNTQMR